MRIAHLGGENPLPMVGAPLENPYRITGDLPQEILDGSTYGNPVNLYPYQLQDDYDRSIRESEMRTVVLENDRLRAVFLPELGGRLWELFDKAAGKHLLHSPSTIQFANLALRNAWFVGGIEWNIGTRGHSPTTCSRLHTAIVHSPDGNDVLRMWEFDRLREVVFQIDAWLPADSAVLLVAIRIRNPGEAEVPMYWWTNAAVPGQEGTRVIAPAGTAFASDYDGGIARVDPTGENGIDCTWPTKNPRARDFFFDIRPEQRPWILAADEHGDGLAMLSTDRLRGRKLFVWGEGTGGHRWQSWLSPDGGRYAEIQAGLAQTQFQHLAMPAGADWSWLEAYGNARVDTDAAHDADWNAAIRHGAARIEALASGDVLAAAHTAAMAWADLPPKQMIGYGTGWGALESARRKRAGISWLDETGTPFPAESITPDQRPWLDLLNGSPFTGARTFVTGPGWEKLLTAGDDDPRATLHLAVMKHAAGEADAARALYERSLDAGGEQPAAAAQAHRGLALLALAAGATVEGLDHYRSACALDPGESALVIEAATAFLAADVAEGALEVLAPGPTPVEQSGRIRFLTAQALAKTGNPGRAAAILHDGIEVADLREGENSIAALWRTVCPGETVPSAYQFSMN